MAEAGGAVAKASSESALDQRLKQAQAFKEEGNCCYKEGRFRDAVSRYHWALLQMQPVNYNRVKEYSLKVLERQPSNAKALYRAGVAFYHLRDYDQAHHYLTAATSRQPKDANVKRYLQLTETQLSNYHQKEKQLYIGMFG